jgi:hypothetical protein
MIIEISICKGNFFYALIDSPPRGSENYTALKDREIPSNIYYSNGKKIIVVKNIEVKDYYLLVYGDESLVDPTIEKKNEFYSTELDILFKYYTTNEKKYQYLSTQDTFTYESNKDYSLVTLKLPVLKERNTLGKENYVDYMNYILIVSEKKTDELYMESTCYLSKLYQKRESNEISENLKYNYDKKTNSINVYGLLPGKTYYMNILAKNEYTGETITYKPIVLITTKKTSTIKIVLIVILTAAFIIISMVLFYIYRQYRKEASKIKSDIENKSDDFSKKTFGNIKNINLNFIKKKYNSLNEDNAKLNDV